MTLLILTHSSVLSAASQPTSTRETASCSRSTCYPRPPRTKQSSPTRFLSEKPLRQCFAPGEHQSLVIHLQANSRNDDCRRLTKKTGLSALSRDLGVELNYDTRTTTVPVPNGKRLTNTPLCNFILNADTIIALPKIKTHSFMIMTLATKIMFGAVPGLTKAKYHAMHLKKSSFADMLLDVLSVATPDLIIMDGIIGMQGEGPGAGDPVKLGVLLASTDPVAMDLAVCRMLRLEPIGIPTLKQAKLRHLWPKEIVYPLLSPDDVAYSGFVLPNTAGYLLTGKNTPSRRPVITHRCTSCGQCHEICPKGAITNTGHKATIDYDKCIRCYACHEVCPEKAIVLEDRPPRSHT